MLKFCYLILKELIYFKERVKTLGALPDDNAHRVQILTAQLAEAEDFITKGQEDRSAALRDGRLHDSEFQQLLEAKQQVEQLQKQLAEHQRQALSKQHLSTSPHPGNTSYVVLRQCPIAAVHSVRPL